MIDITVYGTPAPQGSKRAFAVRGKGGVPTGRVAVIESSHDRVKSWRQAVVDAALGSCPGEPLEGPLSLAMVFYLARPKSHYRTGRNAGQLKDSEPAHPVKPPDASKLLRATEDALTDVGLWRDDAQVVEYSRIAKEWADDRPPGADITVRPLAAGDR
jgi:Holliday junction resolvase RusA-like endonuclease